MLALVLLSVIWGYSWVFLKIGLADAGPFTFAGVRTLLAALCLLLLLPVLKRPLRLQRTREMIVLGLLNTTAAVGCSQWALVEGAANRTSILMFTMPFWTVMLAWPILRERIQPAQWFAIGCAALGLLCIVKPGGGGNWTALGVIMLGAWSWALAAIEIKRILARAPMDLLALTAWQMVFGALGLMLLAWLADEPAINWTQRFSLALGFTALVSTAFGWVLWVYLLHKLPAGMASMMTLFVPVVAVISTSYHLGEVLLKSDLIGMGLIVTGLTTLTIAAIAAHRTATGVSAPE